MTMASEFRKFVMRGNVIDLAVGIIIGAAFGKLVTSMVDDILMPPIGALIAGVDFSSLTLTIGSGEKPATIKYGAFIQTVIQFLVIAFCVFLLVKAVNKLQAWSDRKKLEDPKASEATPTEKLLSEIRDLLKQQQA